MILTVRGLPKDIRLTSVILERDNLNPRTLRMFWCPNCSDSVFQYVGNLVMLVPGETPTDLPIIKECKRCKTKYLINSII